MKRTLNAIFRQAGALGVCSKFKGTESFQELAELFFSPQGIEFCTTYNFPDIDDMRTLAGEEAERLGLFVDSNTIQRNRPRVALFGRCCGELVYDDPSAGYEVVVMHGAKASITATNYTVVVVSNASGEVTIVKDATAKIL